MPSWAGLAGAGSDGVPEGATVVGLATVWERAPTDFPGRRTETSPASPAVSAAAPASIHLRVRLILTSAASRANTRSADPAVDFCVPAII